MRIGSILRVTVSALIFALALGACRHVIPPEALKLTHQSLERGEAQTRRFETGDEASLLSACAGVLQDLGFTLDESETRLGLVVASKDRDAVEAGQVALKILVLILLQSDLPIDEKQKIRVSLVTRPVGDEAKHINVRVTFQRVVWNERGQISRREFLDDPKMYQKFFAKLSKAVFLEAHRV